MNPEAKPVEDNAVHNALSPGFVLSVDPVSMAPVGVGALPAIVEDDTAVYLGIHRRCPEPESVAAAVYNHVDEFCMRPNNVHTGGSRFTSIPAGVRHFQAPVSRPLALNGESPVYRRPGAGGLANDYRIVLGSGQRADKLSVICSTEED